jgi:hypothetical protein
MGLLWEVEVSSAASAAVTAQLTLVIDFNMKSLLGEHKKLCSRSCASPKWPPPHHLLGVLGILQVRQQPPRYSGRCWYTLYNSVLFLFASLCF